MTDLDEPLLALSLQQPMAWAIFHGKGLENRAWPQLARGEAGIARLPSPSGAKTRIALGDTFAIHASAKPPSTHYIAAVKKATGLRELPPAAFMRSTILGTARLAGVVNGEREQMALGTPRGECGLDAASWTSLVMTFGLDEARRLGRWFMGPHALVLREQRELEDPIGQVSGALYFWELEQRHAAMVRAQLTTLPSG